MLFVPVACVHVCLVGYNVIRRFRGGRRRGDVS